MSTTAGQNVEGQSKQYGWHTWMTLQPAASRSTISSRRARASWLAWTDRLTSFRVKDQLRMVTGPAAYNINNVKLETQIPDARDESRSIHKHTESKSKMLALSVNMNTDINHRCSIRNELT